MARRPLAAEKQGHTWSKSGTNLSSSRSSVLLANKYNSNEPLALFTPSFLFLVHILCKFFWGRDWPCRAAWNPRDMLVPRARGTVHNLKLLLCFDILMLLRKCFMLCIASCSMISVTGQNCTSCIQQCMGFPDLPVPNSSAGHTWFYQANPFIHISRIWKTLLIDFFHQSDFWH